MLHKNIYLSIVSWRTFYERNSEIFASIFEFKASLRWIALAKLSPIIVVLKDSICIIYSHQYVIASFAHEMYMFAREALLRICGFSVKKMISSRHMFEVKKKKEIHLFLTTNKNIYDFFSLHDDRKPFCFFIWTWQTINWFFSAWTQDGWSFHY